MSQIVIVPSIPVVTLKHRRQFHIIKKITEETILEWYNRLVSTAGLCDFGVATNFFILEKFIFGLDDEYLERFSLEDDEIDLGQSIKIAKEYEEILYRQQYEIEQIYSNTICNGTRLLETKHMNDAIIKDEPLDLDDRHDPPESYLVNLETVNDETTGKASVQECHYPCPTEENSTVDNSNVEDPNRDESAEELEEKPLRVSSQNDEICSETIDKNVNEENASEMEIAEYLEEEDGSFIATCADSAFSRLQCEGPDEEYLDESGEDNIKNETVVTETVKRSTRKIKKVVNEDFVSDTEEKKSRKKRKDNKKSSKCSPYSDYIEFSDDRTKFTCKFCRRIWTNRSNINSHILLHLNEKPFTCQYCGKRFNTKSEVVRHIRCHTGERPFSCTQASCPKAFRTSDKLKDHINMHNNVRPFKCPDCDKSFIQRGHLTSHRRVHTGERPYACHICKKAFTQSNVLTVHMKVHAGAAMR